MTAALPAEAIQALLHRQYMGNRLESWLFALAAAIAVTLLLGVLKRLVLLRLTKIAERTETDLDDLVVDLVRRTRRLFLLAIGAWVGAHFLDLGERGHGYAGNALTIVALIQSGLWGLGLVAFGIQRLVRARAAEDPARTMGASILGIIGRVLVWTTVLLLCLSNAGVDVTALLTGLGVGGIAVALALQQVLGDLFASIAILLDKPVVVGDAVTIGDFHGTVERIGIKTTRLRSVSGEEIVMGNADVVNSRVRNFKRMRERRSLFSVGVSYETPADKLAAIPGMIQAIVAATPDARFDRAHLKTFGAYTIDFEVVFYSTRPELPALLDAQQRIHLEILRAFEREGIEIPFPTQTLHFKGAAPPPFPPQNELSRG